MDLYRFFPKDGSKKRDLSDQSNNGDEPKRQREDSVADLMLSDEVFSEENLQSPRVIGILLNVLNKLEKQIAEIYQISNTTKTSQIKGEEQLNHVLQTVKFINAKFDEFEKDKKEKEEQIKNLESEVTKMKEEIIDLKKGIDSQEQYSRRNCLLIHGVTESDDENTDEVVLNVLNEDVGVTVDIKEIDRSHRLGKPKPNSANKNRPIIVKFTRYNKRSEVFKKKKSLKGKQMSITESLTPLRMEMLKKAREEHSMQNVWTSDGKIIYKDAHDNKVKIYYK